MPSNESGSSQRGHRGGGARPQNSGTSKKGTPRKGQQRKSRGGQKPRTPIDSPERNGHSATQPHRKPRRRPTPQREHAHTFKPFTPEQLAARAAAIPVVSFPDLPVSARRDEIAQAIRDHQVVIVSGETGSGKTTQLPKICMQLGRGVSGMIGHTQPRRIAARSVADRIAEELGQKVGREPGQVVGYQVRFTDEVGPTTLVKLMTDGILLAEIQSDPLLRRYDTLIIDEAHERSLNIDFILGYLARLLPARPDLKVIITSATIDSKRFAEHFGVWDGLPGRGTLKQPAPVIEVSGRTFPVEIRYRPLTADVMTHYSSSTPGTDQKAGDASSMEDDNLNLGAEQLVLEDPDDDLPLLGYGLGEDTDVETAICHAVDELAGEGDGDILVFLPGERDIRNTEQALLDHLGPRGVKAGETAKARPTDIEIVPLFARLSAVEQHRVFENHRLRRVVLATNVAETSLTVPGIRYVIDPGFARISRYSNRTKVQRLPIEAVSQASANQRAGRCGRVADGIAIRLFSQRDYENRPRFTEPEILRTSLASVILQMVALGLGSIADFPFLDPPEHRAVRDGIATLVEIGALVEDDKATHTSSPLSTKGADSNSAGDVGSRRSFGYRLTAIGRDLARLPIDPRLGRILLEADANGCASEVLVIVAALSIQDVRERPAEHQAAADAAHARLADPKSDFVTYLNLWRYLTVQQRDLSGAAFRRMCRAEFLHYLRFSEWRDVVVQLQQMARPLGLDVHPIDIPSSSDVVHAAKVGGLTDAAARAVVAFTDGSRSVDADQIHRSLLVGFLSNLGSWDQAKRDYQGARGTHFTIWPGSGLARSHPAWVMTAELVETSRLFARTVARIDPAWIEPVARPLLKRVYSEPFWSSAKGAAMVKEKVLLYGLTLVADRPVLLGRLGDQVIDAGSDSRSSRVVTAGSLAGIAQGLLGVPASDRRSRTEIGSVGRDFLAMALADALNLPSTSFDTSSDGDDSAKLAPSNETPEQSNKASSSGTTPPIDEVEIPASSTADTALTARILAREMFIRHALVNGEWRERHRFQKTNGELLEQAREVERRSRTHGLVADEDARFAFFDDLLPDDIVSAGHFNRWWKHTRQKHPDLLTYTSALLLPRGIGQDADGFPDTWKSNGLKLDLSYAFTPGSARDGVTMTIPIEVLQRVNDGGTDWLVPGMLIELITESIRALPKAQRRLLAPAPEVGAQAGAWMERALAGTLTEAESGVASQHSGVATSSKNGDEASTEVDPMSLTAAMDRLARWGATTGNAKQNDRGKKPAPMPEPQAEKTPATPPRSAVIDWSRERPSFSEAFRTAVRILRGVDLSDSHLAHAHGNLPAHLRMTFSVVDSHGAELGSGTDLTYLQRTLAASADNAIRDAVRGAVAEALLDATQDRSNRRGHPSSRKDSSRQGFSEAKTNAGHAHSDSDGSPEVATHLHVDGLTDFPADPLPRSIDSPGQTSSSQGTQVMTLRGFPALVAQGSATDPSAGVRLMANSNDADRHHREGLARLLVRRVRLQQTRVTTRWTGRQALMLAASPYPDTAALIADAQLASALSLVDELSGQAGPGAIRDVASFEDLANRARNLHEDRVYEILGYVVRAMEAHGDVESAIRSHTEESMRETVADVQDHVDSLMYPGFVCDTPLSAMPHLARYLRAGAMRIERAASSPRALDRDLEDMDRIHDILDALGEAEESVRARPYNAKSATVISHVRWLIEELRVSFFAQQLGTPNKVSAKRVLGLIETI